MNGIDALAVAKRYADGAATRAAPNAPTWRRGQNASVWEKFDSTTGWTLNNATVSAEAKAVRHGTQSLRVKATSTTGTAGYAEKTNLTLLQIGRYLRLSVYIPDLSKVARIGVLWFTGPSSGGNYHSYTLQKSNAAIVEGWQTIDFHLDRRPPGGGTPDPSLPVTLLRFYVYPETGTTAEVVFDLCESVQRRPAVVFWNDAPYLEFTEDVLPLLDAAGLPCNIQLRKGEIDSWTDDPSVRPSGMASLNELLPYVESGTLNFGLHVNCQHATDAEFYAEFLAQYRAATALGVLGEGVVVSALQGVYSTQTRMNFLARTAGLMRRGSDLFASVAINGLHPTPPSSGGRFTDLVTKEFDHIVTEETVTGWIDTALADETILSVFGHGTDSLNPGENYRTPLTVYQAFLDYYATVKNRMDWYSPLGFYREFHDARGGMGMHNRLTDWSY